MQSLFTILLHSFSTGLIWVGVTGRVSADSFLVGYVLGFFILLMLHWLGLRFKKRVVPGQFIALIIYLANVLWNGLRSSIELVRIVLQPKIELKTGILKLHTGDLSEEQYLSALSAHGINVTPGQIAIEFGEPGILYIHCLDVEKSKRTIVSDQEKRMRLLRRIAGVRKDG